MRYLDFDLAIETSGKGYTAHINSPGGQAAVDFNVPFSDLELENFLLRVGRTRHAVRRIESSEMASAKAFGGQLFNCVFAGDLRGCLQSSLNEASREAAGLRVRLHLEKAPALAALPWEFLYNPAVNRFLSLSVETPLVRYLDLPERIRPLTVKPPLRILMMISCPSDYPHLDVARESAKMNEALADLERCGLVSVDRQEEATLPELQRRLRRSEYHIFHFVGHGGFDSEKQDGLLVLEDQAKRGRRVSAQYLGTLLHDHRQLRLAVLNACEGARTSLADPFAGTAQTLMQQGIPAVIAMQFEVTDEAAICFTREFYASIAGGLPVDASLAEARKAIFAGVSEIEWGTPVLHMRSPDGQIFEVDTAGAVRQEKPIPQPHPPVNPPRPGSILWQVLDSRWGITALVAAVWALNWIETSAEQLWSVRSGAWLGYDFAAAFNWFERGLSFERHDLAGGVAVYLGSIAYFFLPVVLVACTLALVLRRATTDRYRVLAFAVIVCYGLSLPFYLFLPIPERWAYPDSQAILLSDLWSAKLIETIRPISGLDNCFPSFHVSGTFAVVVAWYTFHYRYRHAIALLGAAVALSTLILGIHWIADIVAGLALAVVSVRIALWMNGRVQSRFIATRA